MRKHPFIVVDTATGEIQDEYAHEHDAERHVIGENGMYGYQRMALRIQGARWVRLKQYLLRDNRSIDWRTVPFKPYGKA